MTPDTPERLAALRTGSPGEDLVSGARLRTRRALDAAARSAATGRAPADGRPRWRMRPALAVAVSAALLVGGGVAAWRAWPHEPAVLVTLDGTDGETGTDGADGSGGSGGAAGSATAGTDGAAEVVVHVVGEVTRPGVVRLPAGSRVTDAVDAAGGASAGANLAALNLARVLTDGEQVVVPGPQVAGEPGTGEASGADELDLNSADPAALEALPGIGPVLAARIVEWRTEHGRFSSVEELAEVSGIGPALLDGLRDLVRV